MFNKHIFLYKYRYFFCKASRLYEILQKQLTKSIQTTFIAIKKKQYNNYLIKLLICIAIIIKCKYITQFSLKI